MIFLFIFIYILNIIISLYHNEYSSYSVIFFKYHILIYF
jgi:hypothetical protein